jgi:hypothetical protein
MEYIIKQNGREVTRVYDHDTDSMPNAVFFWLLRHQGQSVDYAIKHGGYTWEKVKGGDSVGTPKSEDGQPPENQPGERRAV